MRSHSSPVHRLTHCTAHILFSLFIFHFASHLHCNAGVTTSTAYSQVWLKGDPNGPTAHVHEGVKLADNTGWVGIGELLPGEGQTPEVFKAMIRAVDNDAATKWTQTIGDLNTDTTKSAYSVGFSVIQVSKWDKVFIEV